MKRGSWRHARIQPPSANVARRRRFGGRVTDSAASSATGGVSNTGVDDLGWLTVGHGVQNEDDRGKPRRDCVRSIERPRLTGAVRLTE